MPSRALNRLLWAAVLLAIVVLGFKTRDNLELYFAGVGTLDVREAPDGGTVYLNWRGKIAAPMASRIAEAYERYQGTAGTFVLSLSWCGCFARSKKRTALIRSLKRDGDVRRCVCPFICKGSCARRPSPHSLCSMK